MLLNIRLSFITYNFRGIYPSKMRLKLIEYFKDELGSPGVSFLQETCSNNKFEQKWKEELKSQAFFLSRKNKLFWCPNCLLWKRNFYEKNQKKQETLKEGRILIRDVSVNDSEYILINLYNTDNKKEQINVMSNMFVLLEKFETNSKP